MVEEQKPSELEVIDLEERKALDVVDHSSEDEEVYKEESDFQDSESSEEEDEDEEKSIN